MFLLLVYSPNDSLPITRIAVVLRWPFCLSGKKKKALSALCNILQVARLSGGEGSALKKSEQADDFIRICYITQRKLNRKENESEG